MTRYVHRENGVITSAHAEPQPDYAEAALADDDPELVAFYAAAYPPRPLEVSRLRLKLELVARGLLDAVDAAVEAAGATPRLYWAEATQFESDHPLVLQIGQAVGLSPADIRGLFEQAATRTV